MNMTKSTLLPLIAVCAAISAFTVIAAEPTVTTAGSKARPNTGEIGKEAPPAWNSECLTPDVFSFAGTLGNSECLTPDVFWNSECLTPDVFRLLEVHPFVTEKVVLRHRDIGGESKEGRGTNFCPIKVGNERESRHDPVLDAHCSARSGFLRFKSVFRL